MVKVGGSKKRKLSKNVKLNEKFRHFAEIMGREIYKFCENRGIMRYASLA